MNVYQHTDKPREPDKMLGGGGKGQYLSDDGQVFHQREIAELIVVVVSWEVKYKENKEIGGSLISYLAKVQIAFFT